MSQTPVPPVYGLMAEFNTPGELMKAAEGAYAAGYRRMDAYTPYPIEELADVIGFPKTRVPLVVLAGGLLGGLSAFALQYWINVIDYPLNIGGKPYNSWPSFVIVCFELTILFASLAGMFGMFALNGLPMPYHPVFNVERFAAVTRDKFFICIEADDPKFDLQETRKFLESFHPEFVTEVPH